MPRCRFGEPWIKRTGAPGNELIWLLLPVGAMGVPLLEQAPKVAPASNAAPSARKRETLIRIEVLSSGMREVVAKSWLCERFRGEASLPRLGSLPFRG